MKSLSTLLAIIALTALPSIADEAPPAKALRYHEALLKRPAYAASREFSNWLNTRLLATPPRRNPRHLLANPPPD